MQNTVLAAVLTFSDRVLYPFYQFHSGVTQAAALEDQVLAGVIMWVPMSFAYLVPAALLTMRLLSPAGNSRSGIHGRCLVPRISLQHRGRKAIVASFDYDLTAMRSLALGWTLALGLSFPLRASDAAQLPRRAYHRPGSRTSNSARPMLSSSDRAIRDRRRGASTSRRISANGIYSHLNDRLFVDLNSLAPLLSALNPAVPIPPLTATVLENDPYRVGLTARWTLFAGGSILAANRVAQAGVTAAEQDRRMAEHGITTELVDRYFKRRLAAAVLEVRRQALETLTRHREDARRLREAGQIARTDELRAEVAQAEADREFKKASRNVELASVALKSTLGNQVDAIPTTPWQ